MLLLSLKTLSLLSKVYTNQIFEFSQTMVGLGHSSLAIQRAWCFWTSVPMPVARPDWDEINDEIKWDNIWMLHIWVVDICDMSIFISHGSLFCCPWLYLWIAELLTQPEIKSNPAFLLHMFGGMTIPIEQLLWCEQF